MKNQVIVSDPNGTYLTGCTPDVFDPRYAVNPSLEARLRHPCRRRPQIQHTGAPLITILALVTAIGL